MRKTIKILAIVWLLLNCAAAISAQETEGYWKGGINTKLTMRNAEMTFATDAKGLKRFSFDTSFYFYDTENYHECGIGFSRGDKTSKWTVNKNVTRIIDEDENETIVTKTPRGLIIQSGCGNTAFYKIAFTRRGNRYVGREIK